eukprot:scaffold20741_cov99-Isochrysis_galbana.AAC.3
MSTETRDAATSASEEGRLAAVGSGDVSGMGLSGSVAQIRGAAMAIACGGRASVSLLSSQASGWGAGGKGGAADCCAGRPCSQVVRPCSQGAFTCSQVVSPCSQGAFPCSQVVGPCSQGVGPVIGPCSQGQFPCSQPVRSLRGWFGLGSPRGASSCRRAAGAVGRSGAGQRGVGSTAEVGAAASADTFGRAWGVLGGSLRSRSPWLRIPKGGAGTRLPLIPGTSATAVSVGVSHPPLLYLAMGVSMRPSHSNLPDVSHPPS